MDKHITVWLGAYLDGELQPALAKQVRDHLAECNHCRQELSSLDSLSGLLQSMSSPAPHTASFAARLDAQLPARPDAPAAGSFHQVIWWLIPIVVLILGFANRVAINLAGFLMLTGRAGFLGGAIRNLFDSGWLGVEAPSLITFLGSIPDKNMAAILSGLESFWQVAGGLIQELAWLGALVLVCAAWLVIGWNRRSIQTNRVILRD